MGGGGTLIFSYIRRLGSFFGVQTFEYFLGYEDFVDIFGSHHKIGLYLGVISMHFSVFSSGHGTEWGIFWGVAKLSNIFGVLEIPDIFWGEL